MKYCNTTELEVQSDLNPLHLVAEKALETMARIMVWESKISWVGKINGLLILREGQLSRG